MSSKMEEAQNVGFSEDHQPYYRESKERSEPLDSGYFSPYPCCTCRNAEKPRSNGHHATVTFCFDQAPPPKYCESSLNQNEKTPKYRQCPNLYTPYLLKGFSQNQARRGISPGALQAMPILRHVVDDFSNISNPCHFGATPVGMFPIIPLITRWRALWLRANRTYPPSGSSLNDVMFNHDSKPKKINYSNLLGQDCEVTHSVNPVCQCPILDTRSTLAPEPKSQYQRKTDVTRWNIIGAVNVEDERAGPATIELSRPDKSALYVRRHATKSAAPEGQVSPPPPPPPKTHLDLLPLKGDQLDRPSSIHHISRHNRPCNGLVASSVGRGPINRRSGLDECLSVGIQLRNLGDDYEMFVTSGRVFGPVTIVGSGTAGLRKLVGQAIFGALRALLNLDVV